MKLNNNIRIKADPHRFSKSAALAIDGGDIEWDANNDKWTLVGVGDTWESGGITVTVTFTDSDGLGYSPIAVVQAYDTDPDTTMDALAVQLSELDLAKSCTYTAGTNTLVFTAKPGYTFVCTRSGTQGNWVWTPTYDGGKYTITYNEDEHIAFGAKSLIGSATLMVQCKDDTDEDGLEQWRSLPISTNNENRGLSFIKILKTGSTSTLFVAGNMQLLL